MNKRILYFRTISFCITVFLTSLAYGAENGNNATNQPGESSTNADSVATPQQLTESSQNNAGEGEAAKKEVAPSSGTTDKKSEILAEEAEHNKKQIEHNEKVDQANKTAKELKEEQKELDKEERKIKMEEKNIERHMTHHHKSQ